MLIEPRGDSLYVVFDTVKEKTTKGGIIVPDLHSELVRTGTVKAIGKGVTMYKVGERVAAVYLAGTDLTFIDSSFEEDAHRIIAESNLLCVLHDEEKPGIKGKSEKRDGV